MNVRDMMEIAIRQNNYKESPSGSNKTKFGKEFGMDEVPWCAIFDWWCGDEASDVYGGDNPIYKSANAAYIQDLTVEKKGGKWVMKKTSSTATKKKGLSKAKEGDIVDFDFGKNNLYRQHTGLIIGVSGSYYITIEGNTAAEGQGGSQSNGGQVAIRHRHYTDVCSLVRPKYGKYTPHTPTESYTGKALVLPKRGYFKIGDSGAKVKKLQKALNWAMDYGMPVDGKFGNYTLAGVYQFQIDNKLTIDGEFGKQCLTKMDFLFAKYEVISQVEDLPTEDEKTPTTGDESVTQPSDENTTTEDASAETATEAVKLTKADKIVAMAKACAYAYGTKKSVYKYPDGKPKKAYKVALNEAYPDRSSWGKQPRKGASCDVFVGTVARASGVDKKFPRGLDEVEPYMKKHTGKWKKLNITDRDKMKPGDIVYQIYNSGAGHIFIYLGGNRVANAHYVKKTYPIREAYSSIAKKPSQCKKFWVYRRVE